MTTKQKLFGYTVEDGGYLLNAPCGCWGCNHQAQQGHRFCDVPTPQLLAAEEAGIIVRQLDDTGWC